VIVFPAMITTTQEAPMNDRLTTGEVAELLSVTTRTLKRWRAAKEGPNYYRIGGRIYYREAAVQEWIDAQAVNLNG
jgi:excisionase family DNA binding protein